MPAGAVPLPIRRTLDCAPPEQLLPWACERFRVPLNLLNRRGILMQAKPALKPIPDKLYFPIREVAELTGVETYVLRFWEKEFPMLQPVKESSGHRRYRRKDIEMVLEIKRLLYDEGFTIPGARTALQKGSAPATLFALPPATARKRGSRGRTAPLPAHSPEEMLRRVRAELNDILTLLK